MLEIDFEESVNMEEEYPADLKRLPSTLFMNFQKIKGSFDGRRDYISHVGFPLLSYEFQFELQAQFKDLGIKTFVEIEAGTGALTTMLNNSEVTGRGYTLDPDSCEHNWGMKKSPVFEYAREQGWLEFADIRKLKLQEAPDIIVASWIPYEGGEEVLEFFDNNPESDYFMVIGEGYGGCTANDKFHDWLEDNFKHIWTSRHYQSFYAIHDSVEIYRRKIV